MFTPNGQEISNQIAIKSIIESEKGELLGAELNIKALSKDIKVKLGDLVKIYS